MANFYLGTCKTECGRGVALLQRRGGAGSAREAGGAGEDDCADEVSVLFGDTGNQRRERRVTDLTDIGSEPQKDVDRYRNCSNAVTK